MSNIGTDEASTQDKTVAEALTDGLQHLVAYLRKKENDSQTIDEMYEKIGDLVVNVKNVEDNWIPLLGDLQGVGNCGYANTRKNMNVLLYLLMQDENEVAGMKSSDQSGSDGAINVIDALNDAMRTNSLIFLQQGGFLNKSAQDRAQELAKEKQAANLKKFSTLSLDTLLNRRGRRRAERRAGRRARRRAEARRAERSGGSARSASSSPSATQKTILAWDDKRCHLEEDPATGQLKAKGEDWNVNKVEPGITNVGADIKVVDKVKISFINPHEGFFIRMRGKFSTPWDVTDEAEAAKESAETQEKYDTIYSEQRQLYDACSDRARLGSGVAVEVLKSLKCAPKGPTEGSFAGTGQYKTGEYLELK